MQLFPNYLLQNPDDSRARLIYATGWPVRAQDEALQECAKALELSPGDPATLYNAACLYSSSANLPGDRRTPTGGGGRLRQLRLDENDPDLCHCVRIPSSWS